MRLCITVNIHVPCKTQQNHEPWKLHTRLKAQWTTFPRSGIIGCSCGALKAPQALLRKKLEWVTSSNKTFPTHSPWPSCRSCGVTHRGTTPPWAPRGCVVEAPGVWAARGRGRGTGWGTGGRGGWGEREGTGAVCAGCVWGRGPVGAPPLVPGEEAAEKDERQVGQWRKAPASYLKQSCYPPPLPPHSSSHCQRCVNQMLPIPPHLRLLSR